tara:strand:- start:192 stop:398 length:207 start_codon:yes stop_codon:yes gene_type:complete
MTANELADKLQNEKAKTLLYVATIVDSANMLRQQQAEIEALKEQFEDCICQGGHSQAYLKAKGKAQEK